MRSPILRTVACPLACPLLLAVTAACMKAEDGASTSALSRRTPVPTLPPATGKTPPPFKACEDSQNVFTTVDTWTLRYNSQWAANVLVTLVDPNNPNSLIFTHPTKELADKRIISEEACIPAASGNTTIDRAYPIVGGVNLFTKPPHRACPGSKSQTAEEYRYVFVMKDKKYIAVSKGTDGCSAQKQNTPGNCYLWGVVEGNRVITINNACIAGYNIYDRVGGVVSKKICGTQNEVQIQGQPYPAGFILLHEPFQGWQKQTHDCQTPPPPAPPRPPTDPTPFVTPQQQPTPGQMPTTPPSNLPTPAQTPFDRNSLPTPNPQPSPTCNVWQKNGCYDGWTQDTLPPPTVPPQPQQQMPPSGTPVPPTIWYKK